MKEKILTTKKNGMKLLLGILALYLVAVALFAQGIRMDVAQADGSAYFFVPACVIFGLGWIPLCGLKVLKPQEAVVLTLFGNYIGTLRSEGFYAVNPFCTAVNPAAGTKLAQSGDVHGQRAAESAEKHDAQQRPAKDQRLSGQPGRDRHRRDLESYRYGQSGF